VALNDLSRVIRVPGLHFNTAMAPLFATFAKRASVMAMTWLRIGRVTSNNKELVDHPLVLLVEAVAGEGHQASSRKDQRGRQAVDGVVAEVADEEGLVEKAQKEERRVNGLTKADPGGPPISCGQPEGGRNLLRNRKTTPLPRLAALLVTNGKRWKENRSKSSKKKQKG
jgi:hypothetical protein